MPSPLPDPPRDVRRSYERLSMPALPENEYVPVTPYCKEARFS